VSAGSGIDAREALDAAVELALPNGAAPRVSTVACNYARPPAAADGQTPGMPSEAQALRDLLHETVSELPAEARAPPVFPAVELIRAVEVGVDMLILGSRPGGPLRRTLHGSVSNTVIAETSCPLLVCPAGIRERQPA
jgi:nucleotide-binding universal stress UspA family protein